MTVQQLLNNIDSRELSEWPAFFEIMHERESKTTNKDNEIGAKIHSAYLTQKARKI